jgi:hypothetical protein
MKYFAQEKSPEKSKLYRSLWRVWFALLTLVAVCIICGNLTTAWYQQNQDVNSSDNITSAPMEIAMGEYDVYYYPERGTDVACTKTTYSETPAISMMAYDTLIETDDRNDKTAVLFVIPVSGSALTSDTGSFALTLYREEHDSQAAETAEETTDATQPTPTPKPEYLSDYVTVRCAVGSQNLVTDDNAETYENVKNYLEAQDSQKIDVFAAKTFGQSEHITFTFSDYQSLVSEEQLYVFMEIDYDPAVVKSYVSGKKVLIKFGQEADLEQFQSDITDILLVPVVQEETP